MSVPAPSRTGSVWRWLPWLASGAAGVLGAWAGWRFGNQVAGLWLAVIAAANCGVLFALLAGHAADWLIERLRQR
ncbi:MAG: hypothetical protein ING52_14470 [Burkholderiales bacterium]|jgi:hypothetical protein|nr:hypothetical protein [Burkholderiales bacterium]